MFDRLLKAFTEAAKDDPTITVEQLWPISVSRNGHRFTYHSGPEGMIGSGEFQWKPNTPDPNFRFTIGRSIQANGFMLNTDPPTTLDTIADNLVQSFMNQT